MFDGAILRNAAGLSIDGLGGSSGDLAAEPARRRLRALLCASAVFALVSASPALAQAAPDVPAAAEDSPDADTTTDDIIVTGTLVARPGFVSPTPVTSLDSADLNRVSAANLADALNQLPALKPSVTPSSVGNLSKLAGGNFLDLRGLTYLRTLTLIDGKRYVPATPEGAINTNLIPQALIGGVDVVTGGASAAYGSDAVAGVVNLKLDDKLEGVRGSIQGGITDHNDHRNYLASLAFGANFAGGRGHILLGGEMAENGGIANGSSRAWAGNRGVILNPAYTATNGAPMYLHVNDARTSNSAPGGAIFSGPLSGLAFGPNGTTMPFRFGTLVTPDNSMDGGDGDPLASPYVLETPLKRRSAYGGVRFDVTDAVTAYASIDYGRSSFSEASIPSYDNFTILRRNAFLPASVRADMVTQGLDSFTLGRGNLDYGIGKIEQKAETWQAVGGVRGKLGGSWTFDASYSYGRTHNRTLFTGNVINARRLLAIDAVINPVTGGIVCQSTLTDPGNGCVPLNLFGVGSPSQQAIDYITGTSVRDWQIRQQTADLAIRGEPFSTWAGPVSLAVGGQWRRQTVDVTSDPLSIARAFRVGNTQPFTGRITVKEAFGELVVPLAKDESWAQNIDLDIAGRVTDYSTSGTVETWKAGLNYAVNNSFRFRATRSRDIRAPNINELFQVGQTLLFSINDVSIGQRYTVNAVSGGNPFLKPERADTLTAGMVFTPSFLPRFSLSIDYYDIRIKGAIGSLGAQSLVDRCNAGQASFCLLAPRGSDGRISALLIAPVNFQQIATRGVDVEAAYRMRVGGGSIDLHALINYTDKLDLVGDSGEVTRFAGNTDQPLLDGVGGTARWKVTTSATYSTDAYRLSLTGRYVSGGVLTRDPGVTFDYDSVKGRVYLDLSGEVALWKNAGGGKVSLFGVIANALDTDPPFTGYQFQTARQLYDVIGRQYTAGIRFKF
ncbi:TonB-dependent receptor domain-containing protein [Sphingomonas sp.]|uniref:TonB-dependent receptor domain-containing protein n=1 Tax=Sphingomonas sp. TaxID=28214 RepID=UPI003D6D9369